MTAQDLIKKIENAQRYQSNVKDPKLKAGAAQKITQYQNQLQALTSGANGEAPAAQPVQTAVSAQTPEQVLASILNSPLYSEQIKSAFLSDYLPGLAQANLEIGSARTQEVSNQAERARAQAEAVRRVAGNYAARGVVSPTAQTRGAKPIREQYEAQRIAAENAIKQLESNRDVLYGVEKATADTNFMTDPARFGSIGARARQSALGNLMSLPQQYGLTQVEAPSTMPGTSASVQIPGAAAPAPAPTTGAPAEQPAATGSATPTRAEIKARIDAANKFIATTKDPRQKAGAEAKKQEYITQYNAIPKSPATKTTITK